MKKLALLAGASLLALSGAAVAQEATQAEAAAGAQDVGPLHRGREYIVGADGEQVVDREGRPVVRYESDIYYERDRETGELVLDDEGYPTLLGDSPAFSITEDGNVVVGDEGDESLAAAGNEDVGPQDEGSEYVVGAQDDDSDAVVGAENEDPATAAAAAGAEGVGPTDRGREYVVGAGGDRMMDREGRPIIRGESDIYYERDTSGELVLDDEGYPMLRGDAPAFSITEDGNVVVGDS